ncbi:pilus assembly protein TadG-related protein [Embleya sp. NPDC055664]
MNLVGCRHRCPDSGQVTAFVAVLMAVLLLAAGLVLDGGLALAAKADAVDAAQDAARAGAQAIDLAAARGGAVSLAPDRGRQAALAALRGSGYEGTVEVNDRRVTVRVTHRQKTQLLSLAGLHELTVTATGTAEAQHGVLRNEAPAGGTR